MVHPISSKFCGGLWKDMGKWKPKGCSGTGNEFKNILIPSNCSHLKTSFLNSEICVNLNNAAIYRDKGAQRNQKAYIKDTISLIQAVFNHKEIEKRAKKELQKETFAKSRDISQLIHQSIRIQNGLLMETWRKRK